MILFCVETLCFFYLYRLGTESLDNEDTCGYVICSVYDSYYYDMFENICYCFESGEEEYSYSEYVD